MARGINKVTLVGNLGAEPTVRNTQNGSSITTISVGTSESWTDKQTGQKQERTEWHRVKFFGRLAEIVGQYATKGRQVYIEGSLRTEKYTGNDGVEKYSTEIIGREFQLLGSNPNNEQPQQQYQQPQQQQRQQPQQQQRQQPQQQQRQQPQQQQRQQPQYQGQSAHAHSYAGIDDFAGDDDIPF